MEYRIKVNNKWNAVVSFHVVELPDQDYDIDVGSLKLESPDGKPVSFSDLNYDEQKQSLEQAYEAVELYLTSNHETIYKDLTSDQQHFNGWIH